MLKAFLCGLSEAAEYRPYSTLKAPKLKNKSVRPAKNNRSRLSIIPLPAASKWREKDIKRKKACTPARELKDAPKCINETRAHKSADTKKASAFERNKRETKRPRALKAAKEKTIPKKPVSTTEYSTLPKKDAARGTATDTSKKKDKKIRAESHFDKTRTKIDTGSTAYLS